MSCYDRTFNRYRLIFEGHFPWTGEADEFSNKSQQPPRQPANPVGGPLPDQVRLRLGSTPEFSSKADKHPGKKWGTVDAAGPETTTVFTFFIVFLSVSMPLSFSTQSLFVFRCLMIFGTFSHLSSVAVAIAFIAIPQTCYTRRKTSKTSCINIHAFIKNSRHFKKRLCFCVYIPVLSRELKGVGIFCSQRLSLPRKVVRCLAAAQLRDLVRMPNWMGCKFFWGDQLYNTHDASMEKWDIIYLHEKHQKSTI